MSLSSWWDRSIWNKRVIGGPKLLYHGTTKSYYEKSFSYQHNRLGDKSKDKSIWFEKNPKEAVKYAVHFATSYNSPPILIIVHRKSLEGLRRNWFHGGTYSGIFHTFWRADKLYKYNAIMVELKFNYDKTIGAWRDLTSECKKEIARAQAKLLR